MTADKPRLSHRLRTFLAGASIAIGGLGVFGGIGEGALAVMSSSGDHRYIDDDRADTFPFLFVGGFVVMFAGGSVLPPDAEARKKTAVLADASLDATFNGAADPTAQPREQVKVPPPPRGGLKL